MFLNMNIGFLIVEIIERQFWLVNNNVSPININNKCCVNFNRRLEK